MHTETLTIHHACGCHHETRLDCTGPLTAYELMWISRVQAKKLCPRCERRAKRLVEWEPW